MKKILPLMCMFVLLCSSCEKDVDLDNLSTQNLVYTSFEDSFSFRKPHKFWIKDSIRVVYSDDSVAYMRNRNAVLRDTILGSLRRHLLGEGYIEAASQSEADVGVMAAYTSTSYRVVDYYHPYDGWYAPWNTWFGNWGYWGGKGGWSGWRPYDYVSSYRFSTGSLMLSMVSVAQHSSLNVVWYATIHDLVSNKGFPAAKSVSRGMDDVFSTPPFD